MTESSEPRDQRGTFTGHAADATAVFGVVPATPAEGIAYVSGLSAEEQAAVAALPQGCALLLMQRGPGAGSRFLLDSDRTLVGRSERADIFLDDVTVSRKHAVFIRSGDGFAVRDSGSLNGTYVNRARVDEIVLSAGDEVQIGKFRMTFHPRLAGNRGAQGSDRA